MTRSVERLSLSKGKLVRSLHRRKGRIEEGSYLAEGDRLLEEVADDPSELRFLFCREDRFEWLRARFPQQDIYLVDGDGTSLFATENAQGVGAVLATRQPPSLDDLIGGRSPLLYLDRLSDPGNLGTILRTVEWFGLGGVLLAPGSVDLFNPKVVRASMGAILRVLVIEDIEYAVVLESGLPLFGLDAQATEFLGEASDLPRQGIYILGAEADGISPMLRSNARLLSIRRGTPGSGQRESGGESLNAAIAAAILAYELSIRCR